MSIRASVSAQQIVPEKPLPLAGYAGIERLSSGIHDPIFCSAIHLRSGGAGLVILSLDLLGLDPSCLNKIRKAVLKATATPANNLFVGTTQTHSAPATSRCLRWFGKPGACVEDQQYLDFIVEQAAAATSEATVTSRPASLAFIDLDKPGTGAILVREDPKGRIIAVLIVHEDIPDYLGPDNKELSSDFLAATRKQLSSKFGGQPVVCFFPAAQGTKKLLNYAKQQEKGSADEAGKALADLIIAKTRTLKKSDFTDDVKLLGELMTVPAIPRRHIPSVQEAEDNIIKAQKNREEKKLDELNEEELIDTNWSLSNATRTLGFSKASEEGLLSHLYEDYRAFEVQKITIGDVCILGMPCTMTKECAEAMTKHHSGQQLWLAECVNGDMEGGMLAVEGEKGDVCGLLSPIFTVGNGQPLLDTAKKILST